jgi:ankyrin repeat protein
VKVAELLLKNDEQKILINSVNNGELTPLHRAIGKRAVKMVNFLLQPQFKANLSFKNGVGRTVIHFACSEAGKRFISLFLAIQK